MTKYGAIGVKVWLYKGRYGEEVVFDEQAAPAQRDRRRGKRG